MNTVSNEDTPRLLADYFSRADLASELGVDARTQDRWHRLQTGPPRTVIGRQILYRKDTDATWIRTREGRVQ